MAARANSLTEHANFAVRHVDYGWSMPATDVRAFLDAFERSVRSRPLLASAGVRAEDIGDPDARHTTRALRQARVCGAGAAIHSEPRHGTPRVTPLGAYPLLDYLVMTSDSVGAGIQQLAQDPRLVGNPVLIEPHEDTNPIRVDMAGGAAFGIEFTATLMVLHLRAETDGRFSADGVTVSHTPDDAAAWERVLECPVHHTARWNGVRVPLSSWLLPLRRRDPVLRRVLEARAEDVMARLPARAGLALHVQRALASRVAGGDTRIDVVARQLAMSGRTLQRRLAVEEVSYQELLDEVRKEVAARYLSESTTLAICEVAYPVGYSEPAPFHRAFKRWYGMTPEHFRQQRREKAPRSV